jgi:hypothetical protein
MLVDTRSLRRAARHAQHGALYLSWGLLSGKNFGDFPATEIDGHDVLVLRVV